MATQKNFTIATVSNQVQQNHIAWSIPVDYAETLEEATATANLFHRITQKELEQREDFGNGAVAGESIIIHDGENTY